MTGADIFAVSCTWFAPSGSGGGRAQGRTTAAADSTTTQILLDDTIPQSTEGKTFLSVSVSSGQFSDATNLVEIEGAMNASVSATGSLILALLDASEDERRGASSWHNALKEHGTKTISSPRADVSEITRL